MTRALLLAFECLPGAPNTRHGRPKANTVAPFRGWTRRAQPEAAEAVRSANGNPAGALLLEGVAGRHLESPRPREVQPPALGRVMATPQVGGLHHLYQRAA